MLGACSGGSAVRRSPDASTPSAAAHGPPSAATDGPFTLTLSAGRASYRADEPIDDIVAELVYAGGVSELTISGSGSGLVVFSTEELNGTRHQTGFQHDDCVPYAIQSDQPIREPFSKSGGYSADDPNRAYWEQYFAERELRLPAGEWDMTAWSTLYEDGHCTGIRRDLRTTIRIAVEG